MAGCTKSFLRKIKNKIMTKKDLRKMMMKRRSACSKEELSAMSRQIFENIQRLTEFQQGEELLSFITMGSEPDTSKFITYYKDKNKKTAAPKVLGNQMEFFYFENLDDLSYTDDAKYKILEPAEDFLCTPNRESVVLMPGLVFDLQGHRIGYGGGFYDKYLSIHTEVVKIAIAFDFQLINEIDQTIVEPTDIVPDYIVTDKQIIKVSNGGTNERD